LIDGKPVRRRFREKSPPKEELTPLENLRLSASLDGLALTESPPSTTPCANA
jgi:hypothetical protein